MADKDNDNDNLRTASLYINNQLLSRGLLSDGQSIDFARPERNPGGVDATMGRVMSIINDLILRRDLTLDAQRDAQNREALSTTLRTLRAENLKATNDVSRLTEKHADARRKLEIAEASETAARTQLKSADAAVRGLKEEMARAKVLVAQTRASCATEVRRRDRQIDGLKRQLGDAGRARGSSKSSVVTVISVVGDVGAEERPRAGATPGAADLRSETNQFLTELARSLSEENTALLAVVRRTLGKLKDMSGWDKGASQGDGHVVALQTNCDEMERELEAILEHLQTILTNPSFVPIEEVESREEEINRLKEGWVKMESRWQEAVHLMNGWRKRLVANGRGVNMEELDMGLRLSPIRVRQTRDYKPEPEPEPVADSHLSFIQEECTQDLDALRSSPEPEPVEEEESLDLEPAHEYDIGVQDEHDYASESSIFEDEIDDVDVDVSEPNIEILQQSTAFLSSSPLPPRPQLSPLKETNTAGNRGAHEAKSSHEKHSDYSMKAEEKAWDLGDDSNVPEPSSHRFRLPRSPLKAMRAVTPEIEEKPRTASAASDASMDELALDQPPFGAALALAPPPGAHPRPAHARQGGGPEEARDQGGPPPPNPPPPRTNGRRRIVSDRASTRPPRPAPPIHRRRRTRRDIFSRTSLTSPLPPPASPPPQQSP
ncbi:NIMA interactive protein [Verticillium alfalfae VaMs.102]|uniref:NIMA interactive protein n=1 Tax=Verticillium alfalfae (strain VaMs.102 / ATCC MYA-4576 / FGSC 10136) TaxID=526221 RepID=C9S575_VERA1|nr:NIMA interactive protein [Verticillium alfalfae VaMs.102]EEY14175.1 NIMA interactive protein [Verticillium alfalfae VaMs.102]